MSITVSKSISEQWQKIHDKCLEAALEAASVPDSAHLVQSLTVTAGVALDKLLLIEKHGQAPREVK